MISVIVPTYQDAANLELVAKAIDEALSPPQIYAGDRKLSLLGEHGAFHTPSPAAERRNSKTGTES